MDFWTRLVNRTPLSSTVSHRDAAKDPARRLHRFEREYSSLLQEWRSSSNLAQDSAAAERLEIVLQTLTSMLQDETRRPLPHPCIQFASLKQMYVSVSKIAVTAHSEWLFKEAVLFFAALVESEEEPFVENKVFSENLTNLLVRISGANGVRLGQVTEARVVELAFNVTTKIRLNPEILPAWFHIEDGGRTGESLHRPDDGAKFSGRTQSRDFPLYCILIDFIHHDAKVGDFARTGLLYIIEAASSSVELEQWIVESDLSTLMATGLCALYAQLSRKLVIDQSSGILPPVLAFSDYDHPSMGYEAIGSTSPEFRGHLDTFLSHLLFWQDVLNHCRSAEIKKTLLEHFQVIFLQQLLYPSLLQSSDIDGGSSVAVLTYLRWILESLEHPDMIHLILHYLLALSDTAAPDPSNEPEGRTPVSAARKRKSLDLLSMLASRSEDAAATEASPLLFNLVDLVLACLRSQNQQTICVTLQLLSTILRRHHRYAVSTLLHTEPITDNKRRRMVGAQVQELEFLMNLAGEIGGQDDYDEVYESILKDTLMRIESHPCSLKLIVPKISTNNHDLPPVPDVLPGSPKDVGPHTLRPSDPIFSIMLDHLQHFLLNPVETNLVLTDAILDLAVCGYMCIEGWLSRAPQQYSYEEDDEDESLSDADPSLNEEQQHLQSILKCRQRPMWTSSLPRLLSVLRSVCDQVNEYRGMVPRFDDLLQQRREAFQTADVASTPMFTPSQGYKPATTQQALPIRKPTPLESQRASTPDWRDTSRSASPGPVSVFEGFAQRLFSEWTPSRTGSQNASRTGSPSGRRERSGSAVSTTPTPASMPGGHMLAPATKDNVGAYDHRSSVSGRSQSPSFSRGPEGVARSGKGAVHGASEGKRPRAVASQIAAFEAIDQGLLARRLRPLRTKRDKNKTAWDDISTMPIGVVKEEETEAKVAGNEGGEGGEGGEGVHEEGGRSDEMPSPMGAEVSAVPGDGDAPKEGNEDSEQRRTTGHRDTDDQAGVGTTDGGVGDVKAEDPGQETKAGADEESVSSSVSHVLTNAMLLQAFLLELAAVMQVRAALFGEVRFV